MKHLFFRTGHPFVSMLANAGILLAGFTLGRFLFAAIHGTPFSLLPTFSGS